MMQAAENMLRRLTNLEHPANLQGARKAGTSMESIYLFMEERNILRMLQSIHKSGVRISEIVQNMLSFARKSNFERSDHSIEKLLDKTVEPAATDYDLRKQYDFKAIKIIKEYADDLPPVPCEGAKIQQVFLNILRNGALAMSEQQSAAASSPGKKLSPQFILRLAKEKNMLRIEIEDNGPGMNAEIRTRIFEPFYTTKPVGTGTGLGLSVSYFIITENHGGTMNVISEPGRGANFIIRLPLAESSGNSDRP